MVLPSGDFQVSASLRPSGAANAGWTVATCVGASVAASFDT